MVEPMSKYWRVKLVIDRLPENWQDIIKDWPIILSPKHTRDATPDFLRTCPPRTTTYLHKGDRQPAFYYAFYISNKDLTKVEVKQIFAPFHAKYYKLIPYSKHDMDLRKALRHSRESNWGGDYAISKFQTFGKIVWDNGNTTPKFHGGYYYYVRPYYYSKNQLIDNRYWTQKCLAFLPAADSHRNNPYGAGTYDTYSEDTILKVEDNPEVAKIIARKKKRLTDPEKIKKHNESQRKRRETIKKKELAKLEKDEKKLAYDYAKVKPKFDEELAVIKDRDKDDLELALLMHYLVIVNHLAKTMQELEYGDGIYLPNITTDKTSDYVIKKLKDMYQSSNYLYSLKDKVFKKIYKQKLFSDKIKLYAVIPDDPDNVYVHFCDEHNDERHMWGEDPLEFYYDSQEEIDSCPACTVTRQHYYYAFYYFEVKTYVSTSWHIPYPIGKNYLPDINKLPKQKQKFNEGGNFLFGSDADYDELLYALNQNVARPVEEFAGKD